MNHMHPKYRRSRELLFLKKAAEYGRVQAMELPPIRVREERITMIPEKPTADDRGFRQFKLLDQQNETVCLDLENYNEFKNS